jgi:hypothetical protein
MGRTDQCVYTSAAPCGIVLRTQIIELVEQPLAPLSGQGTE